MPFRFLALNRWQLTSFCNIPWMAVNSKKARKQRYCVASNLYFFKECPKGDPLKQFFEHSASNFITARK